jgi:glycosyltransferase involved in cell wall biosynthesis
LKICILQGAFLPVPPELGGAVEKMWYLLGKKFAQAGHDVVYISKSWPRFPDREVIDGVQHVRVKGYETPSSLLKLKILDAFYTFRAIRVVPQDVDVIVTNTFWAPVLSSFFNKAKVYVDVARMPKGQMRFYPSSARLRATSGPVAEAIRRELPASRHAQAHVIPNPLPFDPGLVPPSSEKAPYILYCGRVHPEKGLDLLVRASKSLPEGWTIKIVGPWKTGEGGGGEGYLAELKSKFGTSSVEFLGPIYDPEKLNETYRKATIFVYPSVAEKGETFGLAPLEAMAWAAVPVVSDLACFRDFIQPEINGLIFAHRAVDAQERLEHCLLKLISDRPLRETLAKQALEVRHTHSAASIANLFMEDFQRLIA